MIMLMVKSDNKRKKNKIKIKIHYHLAHTNSLFSHLKTLKVVDINTLQSLIFMYKYKNKLLPASFHDFFTLNSAIHSYPTRNSPNYHLVNPRLLLAHKSIRHHGPDLWNALPDSIKSCKNLFAFKAQMKKRLLSKYVDSN